MVKYERKPNPDKAEGFLLVKPKFKDKSQQEKRSAIYHVRFKVGEVWRRLPLFSDIQISRSFSRNLILIRDCRITGQPLSPDQLQWVDRLDESKLIKLVAWGILDQRRIEAVKTLDDHLDDWQESIEVNGSTAKHAKQSRNRVKKVLTACGYTRFGGDIDCLKINSHVANQGWKHNTRNQHAGALKQFGRWMVLNARVSYSPFEQAARVKVTDDEKKRSLSVEVFEKLLQATLDGSTYKKMSGFERYVLYWLAFETGYRIGELRPVKVCNIDLVNDPPTVTVKAGYSKNKNWSRLSISADLAVQLAEVVKGKLPTTLAFKIPEKGAEMMRHDLLAAKIPYKDDDDEIFSFHALRVQCTSMLIKSNCNIKAAQGRTRHSTSKLLLDTYARFKQSDLDATALAALPKISVKPKESLRA